MPKAYSIDLRRRVVEAYRSGQSARVVSELFQVTIPCIYAWDKLERASGGYAPRYKAGDRSVIDDDDAFRSFAKTHAHSTLKTMAAHWGRKVSLMTLSRKLRKLGITRKKNIWLPGA